MDSFHFFKRPFRYENDDEKTKNETIVFKNVFKNDRLKKTVFKKLVVSLTIVNDKPSLTIVDDETSLTKRGEERKPT